MIEAFHAGYDFHAQTAADIFGGNWKDYTNEDDEERYGHRAAMKNVNFANIYGAGARKVARMCGIPEKEAYRILDEYKARYPEVVEWKAEVTAEAEANGYIETLFGGRIHVPMAQWSDKAMRAYGIRQAINGKIQGTAADIIRIAMAEVHAQLRKFRDAWLLLQVHDELVVECNDEDAEEVCALVMKTIETCTAPLIKWRVPIVSKGKVAQNWKEAK
jgi:DNA polymerase-1